jgi:hypothetical protein
MSHIAKVREALSFDELRYVREVSAYGHPDHPTDDEPPNPTLQRIMTKYRVDSFNGLVSDLFRRQLI